MAGLALWRRGWGLVPLVVVVTVLASLLAWRVGLLLGVLLLQGASPALVAVITAVAAGAILAMVADTMIPEAFEQTHLYAGLIATVGFALSFGLERLG